MTPMAEEQTTAAVLDSFRHITGMTLPADGLLAHRYKILARIGEGGMGSVFKAMNTGTEQLVAIKVINRSFLAEISAIQRFRQEATVLATLSHPNVVSVKAIDSDSGRCFMVLEYLEGRTLKNVVQEDGPMKIEHFRTVFSQILKGLSYAHAQGIIHRDLKPDNIMLLNNPDSDDTSVKILDFGLCKLLEGQRQLNTQTGAVIGSPAYMSPEQFATSSVDKRADIYSIGCVMYYALAGKAPFDGQSALELASQHISQPLPELPEQYAQFDALIARATSKNPDERYADVDQFIDALQHGEKSSPRKAVSIKGPAYARSANRGNSRLLAIVAGIFLAVLACFAYQRFHTGTVKRESGIKGFAFKRALRGVMEAVLTPLPRHPEDNPDYFVCTLMEKTNLTSEDASYFFDMCKHEAGSIPTGRGFSKMYSPDYRERVVWVRDGLEALALWHEINGDAEGRDKLFRIDTNFMHQYHRAETNIAVDWAICLWRHGKKKEAIDVLGAEWAFAKQIEATNDAKRDQKYWHQLNKLYKSGEDLDWDLRIHL